jgi:hypothetical protein
MKISGTKTKTAIEMLCDAAQCACLLFDLFMSDDVDCNIKIEKLSSIKAGDSSFIHITVSAYTICLYSADIMSSFIYVIRFLSKHAC